MVDKKSEGSHTADTTTTPPPSTTAAVGAAAASSSSSSTPASAAASTTNPKEEWKPLAPMTKFRVSARGILCNDHQFLIMGGVDENQKLLSSCEYYDANTEAWNSLPINMPTGRFSFGVARVGYKVYVMGGRVGSEYRSCSVGSNLISFDVSGSDLSTLSAATKWDNTLAPMNHTRFYFACVSHLNFIYVFGGYIDDENNTTNTAERYNINTNQWENLPNMLGKRSVSSAGVIGNKIYVVGGEDENRNALATTIVFDTAKQQWEPSTTVPDMKTKRLGLSVVIVDHFVLAIGGKNQSDSRLSTIEVLDTERNSWNDAPTPMNHGRYGLVTGFLKETNEIIVAGGFDTNVNALNTADSISFEKGLLPSVSLE